MRGRLLLGRAGGHPQRDLRNTLADPTDCVETALILRKLIPLRLHGAAPMVSGTPIAHEDHLLRQHEHNQLLQDQFHTCIPSPANRNRTPYFVPERESALTKR